MNEHKVISPIPDNAVEVIEARWDTGHKQTAHYFIEGKQIGFRHWYPSGILAIEYGLQNGIKHGPYRTWHENAQLEEDSAYLEGKEHGEIVHYDWDGVRIGSYIMDQGTGLDLWYSAPGILSEEREYRNGERHGFERWWWGDNKTIVEESHFKEGVEHGIFRQWNMQQKLRRGYPQYYILGKRVNKRQYVRACRIDPTLVPFVPDDNLPFRKLPKGVLQSVQAKSAIRG